MATFAEQAKKHAKKKKRPAGTKRKRSAHGNFTKKFKKAKNLKYAGQLTTEEKGIRQAIIRARETGKTQSIKIASNRRGQTNKQVDSRKRAQAPGWRVSPKGNLYYEIRRNRSDSKGSSV